MPAGVAILRVEDDLGPATKALYAARDLRGQAVDIVYGDDDHHYLPDWSQRCWRRGRRIRTARWRPAGRPSAFWGGRTTAQDLNPRR